MQGHNYIEILKKDRVKVPQRRSGGPHGEKREANPAQQRASTAASRRANAALSLGPPQQQPEKLGASLEFVNFWHLSEESIRRICHVA